MDNQLIFYYKNSYNYDFDNYFRNEYNDEGLIVSSLIPKTIGYPGKTPWHSIYFASITWFILCIPQIIGVYCGEKAMLHFHKLSEWPIFLENKNLFHPFHSLAAAMLLPEVACCKMASTLDNCEEFMLPALKSLLPHLLYEYAINEHINEICSEIRNITDIFKEKLVKKHKWPWFNDKLPCIYRPFPIYYHKFNDTDMYVFNDKLSLEKSIYYQYIKYFFIGLDE